MPTGSAKSKFGAFKRKAKKSFEKSRGKEAKKRGARVPAGIVGGTAELTSWDVSTTDDKKVPYLMLGAQVITPEEYEGARINIMHFLEPNEYNSMEDITDNICSDLKLLDETGELVDEDTDIDDLDSILDQLIEAAPVFRFNSTGSKKSDRVYYSIQGLVDDEDVEEDDDDAEVEEEEEAGDEEEAEDLEAEDTPIEELIEAADSGDEDAIAACYEWFAEGTEVDPDEYQTWAEAYAAIEDGEGDEADEGAEDGEPDEEEEVVPAKGDYFGYKATPKGSVQEVVVQTIRKANKTCTIKRVSDGKIFKDVKWEKLESLE